MRFPLKCAFAACALLAFALFALSSDSQRAAAGEHYRGHGGGGGGGGWSGGVGVGTILLNEAIRRQQEKQQYKQHVTQPKGCPEGMTWSRKKRTCVNVKGPEIAKCEPPKIKTRKGCVYPQPETASCTWPKIKSGKGCAALEATSGSTGNV